MTHYQRQKETILQLIRATMDVATNQENEEVLSRLQTASDHLSQGKLFVAVCGEFKQGKSSLINAILGDTELCPVDVDIATNLVSTISYAEEEKISVVVGKSGKEEVRQIQRADIPQYVTEKINKGNVQKARLLTLETPNPQLRDGMVLVDTPGVGGLNARHTDITFAFIPNSDLVLFVSDALAPMSSTELDFIKTIYEHCRNIIFVVTKIDSVPDSNAVVDNNRMKLAQWLEVDQGEIAVVPVSSLAKLDYLKTNDPEDLTDSNFALFENTLWEFLEKNRGNLLLMRAINDLGRELVRMKKPLQAEWDIYHDQTKKTLNKLKDHYRESRQRLEDLLKNNADWRTLLSDDLHDLRIRMNEKFQEGFVLIRREADARLSHDDTLKSPEQLIQYHETAIHKLMTKLWKQMNGKAEDVYAHVEESSGLSLTHIEMDTLISQKSVTPVPYFQEDVKQDVEGDSSPERQDLWKKSRAAARGGLFNSQAGAVVGGLFGAAVGGGIGLLLGGVGALPGIVAGAQWGAGLGAVGGFASGAKEGLSQIQEKERQQSKRQVSKILNRFTEDSQKLCQKALAGAVTKLERSMRDDFSSQLSREKEACERTIEKINQSSRLSQQNAAKKSLELKKPYEAVDRLLKRTETVAEEIILAMPAPCFQVDAGDTLPQTGLQIQRHSEENEADYGEWADE